MDQPLPLPPTFPTDADQTRRVHQEARAQLLTEEHDQLVADYFERHIGRERMATWGPPDISLNTISDICTQLSTPGLYGQGPPEVKHADPNGQSFAQYLVDSGYWSRMQYAQYLTIGIGDLLLFLHVDESGSLSIRNVYPHNVFVKCDVNDPQRITDLWELRLRVIDNTPVWCWDVFCITGTPTARIYTAVNGGLGRDVTSQFISADLTGEAYPYRYADGRPFIPYAWYKDIETGATWNTWIKRGAARGALNGMLYNSYAGYCAKDATGSTTAIIGAKAPSTQQDTGLEQGNSTLTLHPGTMIFLAKDDSYDGQPVITTIGPAANLEVIARFAAQYNHQQAVRWGLNPSDLQRTGNDPMSGAALFISQSGKREFSQRCTPAFRRSDIDAIGKIAALYRLATGEAVPEKGYTVTYRQIARSPDELRAEREQQEFELAQGLISPVDVYLRNHPGASREDAINQLTQVKVQQATISMQAEAALKAAGLVRETGQKELLVGQMDAVAGVVKSAQLGEMPVGAAVQLVSRFLQVPVEEASAILSTVTVAPSQTQSAPQANPAPESEDTTDEPSSSEELEAVEELEAALELLTSDPEVARESIAEALQILRGRNG